MAKVTLDKNGLAKASGTLTVYSYDAISGGFTGASDEYLLQGLGLPANATTTAPPDVTAGSIAIWRDEVWQTVSDHRGETVYSTADGAPRLITETGDYPADTTTLKPATGFDKWDGEKWVTDADAQKLADEADADKQKSTLISIANTTTQAWQTQLMLGIITGTDKEKLTHWMKYIQDVQAVDTSAAPDIVWPDKPE
ncbi:tail fiber assembly protein [Pantoea phytobeneficialis]|uniref:Phage tail protein n=1 Tax=Pantoea phytobeneficialis TaxID=2052056 RepID=A0AAP9H7U4_9GAMM|nr:tail fiber assembly protein [Pantoea phytobeneficialis]MDO6408662.1 tail fiber assembly protein [Pantoea phytobeneficialis]QGR08091.1 phage tail protein [Pantoea phytobeneficialis]